MIYYFYHEISCVCVIDDVYILESETHLGYALAPQDVPSIFCQSWALDAAYIEGMNLLYFLQRNCDNPIRLR